MSVSHMHAWLAVMLLLLPLGAAAQDVGPEIIGRSVEGRPITVERVGEGPIDVLLVGGIHGGYEWNSIVLARRILEHYRDRREEPGGEFTLHVIDNMNPDGLHEVTGGTPIGEFDFSAVDSIVGRLNANGVDLNRNWDGDWQPTSYWGTRVVDAGTEPFSEPETRAVRDYFLHIAPAASVFYQSAAAGLWYSGAEDEWEPARRLARTYSQGSGYPLPPETGGGPVDYEITGSADDYFYEIGHPNLTVELTTHFVVELDRNLDGLRSLLAVLRGGL